MRRRALELGGGCAGAMGMAARACCVLLVLGGCERSPCESEALPIERMFGEGGDNPGQFTYPRAIDADATSVWVVDKLARVQRIDAKTGASLGGWRMPQWKLGKPTGVTVWVPPDDSAWEFVFVPDTHYHRVVVYGVERDPKTRSAGGRAGTIGEVVAEFGEYGTGPGQFIYTTDVVVQANASGHGVARVFVSEYGGNDRISIYERADPGSPGAGGEYRFVTSFGKFGIAGEDDADGSLVFNRPQSIELDEVKGELIVADACNHRVGRVALDGKLVAWYGSAQGSARSTSPERAGQPLLLYPYGLELPGDGTALIAEFGGARVHRVDLSTGASLGTYGKSGRGEGELLTPWGVAVVAGEAYVLDSGNNRVQVFEVPRARRVAGARGDVESTGGGPGAHGSEGTGGLRPSALKEAGLKEVGGAR